MSRMYHTAMVALCLAALTGVFASNAAAENVTYDFSRVTSGQNLLSQDNWANYATPTSIMVSNGETGWSGNYATSTGASSIYTRLNDGGWSFSLQDNLDWEFSAKFGSEGDDFYNIVGLDKDRGFRTMCLYVYGGELRWKLEDDQGGQVFYHKLALPSQSAKIYRLGIEAAAKGGGEYTFKAYYEDLSVSGPKVYVGSPVDAAISVSTRWNGLDLRMASSGIAGRVDDICISQVPEPSTLTLLAAGLVGLLAYAWRKRK